MTDSMVVVLMCLSMVISRMVSIVFVSWELIIFYGLGVGFEKNKIIFYSFRKVKWPLGFSRTLFSDIQCLRNTYSGLEDDLAFDVMSPGLGHPSSFTVRS